MERNLRNGIAAFALFLGLALALPAAPALAPARLLEATPAIDSSITASPTEVRLIFSARIEPRFSGFKITRADGEKVFMGQPVVQDREMAAAISTPLEPGAYRVEWHLLSADGHEVQGDFTFEVRP